MTRWVTAEGQAYEIIESLGYNHDIGAMAWIVRTPFGEQTAVGRLKAARFV